MKILFSADWHIKLGQEKVPKSFQKNRFMLLAQKLHEVFLEHKCDLHILGGDVFDVSKPSTDEIELLDSMLEAMPHKGIMYTGNHEMLSKTISCLTHLRGAIYKATGGKWDVVDSVRSKDFDIIPYSNLHSDRWPEANSKLCFTHVRGEIPPHVVPEIDLNRFVSHGYTTVIAGDLHSNSNTQDLTESVKLWYPGSPLTTSFHRSRTVGTNGVFIIDTETHKVDWVEFGSLPQLIRRTIKVGEEMVADLHDRVIYEVEGDVLQLKAIKDSDLLDKRMNIKVTKDAKLDLGNKSILEELELYLTEVQNLTPEDINRLKGKAANYVSKYNT